MATAAVSPPSDLSMPAFLGISCTFVGLAGLFVAVRLAVSWRQVQSTFLSILGNVFCIIALATQAATIALFHEIIEKGSDPTVSLPYLVRLNIESSWIASIAMWISKVPLLMLYITIFGVKLWVRGVAWFTIGASAIVYLTSSSIISAKCPEHGKTIDVAFLAACAGRATDHGFILGVTSLLTDIIVFLTPIAPVLGLKMSGKRKFGLILVFSSGLIAIAASATALHYKIRSRDGHSDGAVGAELGTIIDATIALMVSCVPALSSFWIHTVKTSSVYYRLASLTRPSASRSEASGRSEPSSITESERKNTGVYQTASNNNSAHIPREEV